jgi:hypothetical protein
MQKQEVRACGALTEKTISQNRAKPGFVKWFFCESAAGTTLQPHERQLDAVAAFVAE